jgi:hypothetical protein
VYTREIIQLYQHPWLDSTGSLGSGLIIAFPQKSPTTGLGVSWNGSLLLLLLLLFLVVNMQNPTEFGDEFPYG